ncbi:hypothetical protein ACFYMW_10450 [Streptomyces sp. NPDC006692]|uniref:hypothetical protein n=1 Tax=Streptomyces sp. NPDC006692 TaxID=3364758 RepID=UPI0036A8BCC4
MSVVLGTLLVPPGASQAASPEISVTVGGHRVQGIWGSPGVGYRDRNGTAAQRFQPD